MFGVAPIKFTSMEEFDWKEIDPFALGLIEQSACCGSREGGHVHPLAVQLPIPAHICWRERGGGKGRGEGKGREG